MAFKIVILFATLAAVNCGVLQPAGVYQQQHTTAVFPQQAVYHAQPSYHAQPAYHAEAAYHAQPAYHAHAQPAYYQPAATIVKQATVLKQVVHEEPANYEFNYDVHDTHTGDIKQQHEKAVNGVISGQYSLIEADGHRRIVDYTADDHHGFNAQVRREPLEGHKTIIKTVQPTIAVQKLVAQPWQQPQHNAWQQPARSPWY